MKVLIAERPVSPELIGLFGLSWPEKVAKFMSNQLKGTALRKKLKSFWGAGGLNTTLVKNLHNEYMALMARNYAPADFVIKPNAQGTGGSFTPSTVNLASMIQQKTNIDSAVILEFLRAMYVLARDGKIPFNKWNPKGFKESTALRKTFTSEKGFIEAAQKTGNYAKIALIVAGLGAGAYFLSQVKGFKGGKE